MKKATLCTLALCLALTGAPLSPAEEVTAKEVAELTATAPRLGYPQPPAHMSKDFRDVIATLFGIVETMQQGQNLTDEEKSARMMRAVMQPVQGTGMAYCDLSLLEKQLPKKLKGKKKWFAIRDFLTEKAKDNPEVLISLYGLIRQNIDEVPAEMKTDAYMLSLVEKSAAAGDITACQLAAYFHIWGFYGAKVDAKAAVDNLLQIEHYYLRRNCRGFHPPMEYAAMLCREGRELLPLRICALSMAKRFYVLDNQDVPEQTICTQGKALADLSKQGGNLGKFLQICPFSSVLDEFATQTPEFWLIAADLLETKGGSAEGVESLRQRAIQQGADPKRDFTPTSPAVDVYRGVHFHYRYLSEEEQAYISDVLVDLDKRSIFLEEIPTILGFVSEMLEVNSAQELFAYKKKMYSAVPDIGMRFFLLYGLYHEGVGPDGYGKDEDEAAIHLEMACNMDNTLAQYEDIKNRLMQGEKPTEELVRTLLQTKLAPAFQLLHKMVKDLPADLQEVSRPDEEVPGVTDKFQHLALEYGDADAWLEWAEGCAAKEGDLDAQVIALSFMAAANNCTAEGYLQLEETLSKYAEAHPETADLVKLLRIAALELSLSTDSEAERDSRTPYFQRHYPGATEKSTCTEAAKRLEALVKDGMSPEAFQELHRRLEIDIKGAKE